MQRAGLKVTVEETIRLLLCDNLKNEVWTIIEGLFDHFFSPYRKQYYYEDVDWFMELSSLQYQWIPALLVTPNKANPMRPKMHTSDCIMTITKV